MDHERLLIDLIEDFDEQMVLQSAKYRLLVIEKNITNIKRNMEICVRENTDTKQRIKICQNRISFIEDDLRSIETLKYNIEAKIAEFIEYIESPDSLPVVYDPQLELFIDQKVEYYTNHVVRHRALLEKKNKTLAYIQRLEKIIEEQNKELVNHHEMIVKYNIWIPELRYKQVEMSAAINAIEEDIITFLDGTYNLGVSPEICNLIKGRFDLMQDVLEDKMRTLMQLNGFSHHIQSESDQHKNAIVDLNEKNRCLEEEIKSSKVSLEDTDMELQTVEMKYSKVEQQIFTYINIQEKFNFVHKCRAYYDLLCTYGKEKENAQRILNSFQVKNLNEVLQLSSLESNLASWLDEKRQMEAHISSLVNSAM